MNITEKSDEEILKIAQPMIDVVVSASNEKNWDIFSKYQTPDEANDPENKKNVLKQWEEYDFLSSLNIDREILCVLRRDEVASIVWKQTSYKVGGEFLAVYSIKEIAGEVKEVAFVTF